MCLNMEGDKRKIAAKRIINFLKVETEKNPVLYKEQIQSTAFLDMFDELQILTESSGDYIFLYVESVSIILSEIKERQSE